MEQALYGPEGYYSSGRAQSGQKGDYFTAPDTGPLFGRLLGAIFSEWKERFGLDPCQVVEAGPGEGALERVLTNEFPYAAIERSPARRQKLAPLACYADFTALPASFQGCILANELVDAFPVHRVRMKHGRLEEGYVTGRTLVWNEPSTPRLQAYLDRLDIALPDDYKTEINLAMRDWVAQAAGKLDRGMIVLIDYGRPAHEYYAPERDRGTLRSFRNHRVDSDFLGTPGLSDLTADVDFTSLALDALDAGLEPLAFMEMGSFLLKGAKRLLDRQSLDAKEARSLQMLIHPDGLGSAFHVLVLGKGIPANDFIENNRLHRLGLKELHHA